MPKNLTISPIDPTKCWFFDFDYYLTGTDGFARGVSDELEQQRRFFDILNRILDTAADNFRIAKLWFRWVSIPTTSPMTPYSVGR